jgi:hypothetical protein
MRIAYAHAENTAGRLPARVGGAPHATLIHFVTDRPRAVRQWISSPPDSGNP